LKKEASAMKIFLLLVFWALWFLAFSTRTLFSPLLPVIEDELVISHTLAGSLFTFLSFGYTITLFISGFLCLRIGYKRTIVVGFGILILSFFLLNFTTSYSDLVLILFFIGLGAGMYVPSATPLITETFSRRHWGKAIAFHESAAAFSVLCIPLLVAVSLPFFQWRTLFVILSGVCLVVVLIFSAITPEPCVQEQTKARLSHIILRRDFWVMTILWSFASMASNGVYSVTPLFLVKEKGMDMAQANTIFGYSRIGVLLVTVLMGFLLDRYGVKKILLFVIVTTGLSTAGVAIADNYSLLVMMLFFQATLSGAFFPVGIVTMSVLTTTQERGIFAGGALAIGTMLGLGITPLALGAVADIWSFRVGILVLGILVTFCSFSLKGLRRI
jgi:NNP family nitrate/nitrite transporter-like MFS transporter